MFSDDFRNWKDFAENTATVVVLLLLSDIQFSIWSFLLKLFDEVVTLQKGLQLGCWLLLSYLLS